MPTDAKALIEALPKNIQVHCENSYSDDWIQKILKSPEKVIVVAHSWGCYRFLVNIKKIENKIERAFMINPYLEQEKPLSTLAKVLLSTPLLGNFILKRTHQKSYQSFFENMISPKSVQDHPYYKTVLENLSDPQSWKKALLGKKMQGQHPIKEMSNVLGFAYIGDLDFSCDIKLQLKAMEKFPYLQIRHLKNSGHGILWSDLATLIPDILASVEKFGYNPGSSIKNNVINFLEKHVQEHGSKIALKWTQSESLKSWDGNPLSPIQHDEITFFELEDRIAKFAKGLLEIGIQKGDRVIIFLPMSVHMYTAMFAVQRIGAIAVFLDSWARSHHLGASAECVQPKAMISFEAAFKLVDQVPEFYAMPLRILFGPGEKFTHRYQDLFKSTRSEIASVESEFTGLITFTTGSTGKPKGANRTHRFLVAQHFALTHVIPYFQTDLDMPAFPIFSLNSLATGVTTILPAINLAQPSPTDSAILASQILSQKITCTTLSPSMLVGLAQLCAEKNIQLSGLRRVVTGGAAISKDDVRAFYKIAPQTELWILYGSTEAEPMAHIEGREMLHEHKVTGQAADTEIVESGVNVGEISEDIDYKLIHIHNGPLEEKITDWSKMEVAAGEVGEFICTGDHVCRDYYNNPEAFKSTKILGSDNRVWHRTGDLVYVDQKKNLWIVGRVNNAIERNGAYYFPVQAEVLLKRLPFTGRCAFLGLPSVQSEHNQETCVAIEFKDSIDPLKFDYQNAKDQIQKVFKKNNIPVDQIKFVKKIPMDPRHHSKVEYATLRKSLLEDPEVILA